MPDASIDGVYTLSEETQFESNQIKRILPYNNNNPAVKINNNPARLVPADGIEINKNWRVKIWADRPIKIEYFYKQTYPPDVIINLDGTAKVSTAGGAFLMKRLGFTNRAITLPTYDVTDSVLDFAFEARR
jgi:hypothetical protein